MNNETNTHGNDVMSKKISNELQYIVLASILFFTIIGNVWLIHSIVKQKKKRRRNKDVSGRFIANLAVCDLTLVLSSIPVDLAEIKVGYFPFGNVGCHTLHPLSTIAFVSMSFALVLLALERFTAVLYPFKYFKLQKIQTGLVILSHIISFTVVFPYGWVLHIVITDGRPFCKETWPVESSTSYTVALFLVQYGIPLPIISFLYFMTWKKLKNNYRAKVKRSITSFQSLKSGQFSEIEAGGNDEGLKRKKNVFNVKKWKFFCNTESQKVFRERTKQTLSLFRLFTIIIAVFAIFMLPNQVVWLYLASHGHWMSDTWTTIAYWLTYSSSVLNPVIYGANQKFPKIFLKLKRSLYR